MEEPSHAPLPNPFTGSVTRSCGNGEGVAVTTALLMVFISTQHDDILWEDHQSSECLKSFCPTYFNRPTCLMPFTGKVYSNDWQGAAISLSLASGAGDEKRLRHSCHTKHLT
jgi:hypothetical protein